MGLISHAIDRSEIKRGDHIYAFRAGGIYQHHGIVITIGDVHRFDPGLCTYETFMVVEQNQEGLRIVTLDDFALKKSIFHETYHTIRRVQYDENPFVYGIKRRGTSYTQKCLPAELIVENARLIYTDPKENEKWKTYSLFFRNCEHFAFECCTSIGRLSEQVLGCYDLIKNATNMFIRVVPLLWSFCKSLLRNVMKIGEKIIPSSVNNLTITSLDEILKKSVEANAITAAIALGLEVAALTIRWVLYYRTANNQEQCDNLLASGFAIDTRTYVKCLMQAGLSNASSFVMSVAGAGIGSLIPVPCATAGFSIFLGFISYVFTRWSSGPIIDMLEDMMK